MSNLDYNLPEPTKAQLEYARYLSRFQAPRERRTLFARTESDIAAAFREETANHSWNADDLASQAGIDTRFADALLQRGEAPIEAVFSASTGGYTESSENVWNTAVPYLRAVSEPGEYGDNSWTKTLTLDEPRCRFPVSGTLGERCWYAPICAKKHVGVYRLFIRSSRC